MGNRTREDRRLDAIGAAYHAKFYNDQVDLPLSELNELYGQHGRRGPPPVRIVGLWLAWKEHQLQKGTAVRDLHVVKPGTIRFEYDTKTPVVRVVRELSTYLKAIRSFSDWEEARFEEYPKSTGNRSENPINARDLYQDGLIVVLKNAGMSHSQVAKVLQDDGRLGWPRQLNTAVNRLKKRIGILRKNLGEALLPE